MKTSSFSAHLLAFLTILCITSQITPIQAIQPPNTTPKYTEFLKASCKTTLYPELCYNSLSNHARAFQTSPQMLANAALSVTLSTTRSTTAMISRMSKGANIRPREAGALRDCLEELNDAVSELQRSIKEMSHMKGGAKKLGLKMSNIQTWVSAALTDEDACMDGFGGKRNAIDEKLKKVVREKIVKICHLTSNSLALINCYASSM
ncbi:Pectinesterase inhibitor 7 [Bienertia sinuspersici]